MPADRPRSFLAGAAGAGFRTNGLVEIRRLDFEPPDIDRFPALKLAFEVAAAGGTAPAVFNAANEVAVAAFLDRTVKFTEIVDIIRGTLDEVTAVAHPHLQDVIEADRQAREVASEIKSRVTC